MISDIRAKHGKDSVKLRNCGKFTLAEDLSDISDITSIDLSNIGSLEGEPLEKFRGVFFCAPQSAPLVGTFLTIPFALPQIRTHHTRTGNIQVLKNCPNLTFVNFGWCRKVEGEHTSNEIS